MTAAAANPRLIGALDRITDLIVLESLSGSSFLDIGLSNELSNENLLAILKILRREGFKCSRISRRLIAWPGLSETDVAIRCVRAKMAARARVDELSLWRALPFEAPIELQINIGPLLLRMGWRMHPDCSGGVVHTCPK